MKLKSCEISPLTVGALKELLEQMPDTAMISYQYNGSLYWNKEHNILEVSEA